MFVRKRRCNLQYCTEGQSRRCATAIGYSLSLFLPFGRVLGLCSEQSRRNHVNHRCATLRDPGCRQGIAATHYLDKRAARKIIDDDRRNGISEIRRYPAKFAFLVALSKQPEHLLVHWAHVFRGECIQPADARSEEHTSE